MHKKHTIITIAIAIVIGAAGFFGGFKYGQTKTPASARAGANQFGQFAQNAGNRTGNSARRAGNGNNFVNGTILSKDSNSITVQVRAMPGAIDSSNAGSKIVILSGNTQITKSAPGSATDLAVGTNVLVTGSANPDNSITAQNIQIRPEMPNTPPANPPNGN